MTDPNPLLPFAETEPQAVQHMQLVPDRPPAPFDELSEIELAVVDLASRGYSRLATAEITNPANPRQVERHRTHILVQLSAFNIAHAVRIGCDSGLFIERLERPSNMKEPSEESRSVLNLFSYGHNKNYVGQELGIGADAARMRRVRAIHSLGAKTFAHAVRLAWQEGFLND